MVKESKNTLGENKMNIRSEFRFGGSVETLATATAQGTICIEKGQASLINGLGKNFGSCHNCGAHHASVMIAYTASTDLERISRWKGDIMSASQLILGSGCWKTIRAEVDRLVKSKKVAVK